MDLASTLLDNDVDHGGKDATRLTLIRGEQGYNAVETAQHGLVDDVGAIGGRDPQDAPTVSCVAHFFEQTRKHPCTHPTISALSGVAPHHRLIDLVNKDNDGMQVFQEI